MLYVKRFDMLLVYCRSTVAAEKSKIIKLKKGKKATVFVKKFIGSEMKKKTMRLSVDEAMMVLNCEDNGLRALFNLKETGCEQDKMFVLKGRPFRIID
jgi:hypothetical protein